MKKTNYLILGAIVTSLILGTSKVSLAQNNSGQPTIRERINADIKARNINAKNNQEVRNNLLENHRVSSTTPERNRQNTSNDKMEIMEKQKKNFVWVQKKCFGCHLNKKIYFYQNEIR
jgi:uncharacterized protein HemX